jgi:phage gp46-like protein
MGAGAFPAGHGPAGHDPAPEPSPAPVPRAPGVPLFDGALRDFPNADNGDLERVHWVDQKVALKLTIKRGAVSSSPALGSLLATLKRGAPAQLQNRAEDAVRNCLAQMIADGEVELLNVVATSPARGKLLVVVEYRNLLLPNEKPHTVKVTS